MRSTTTRMAHPADQSDDRWVGAVKEPESLYARRSGNHHRQSGIITEVCSEGGMNVTGITNGSWIRIRGGFRAGAAAFYARVASAGLAATSSCGSTARPVAHRHCVVAPTGGWQTWTIRRATSAGFGSMIFTSSSPAARAICSTSIGGNFNLVRGGERLAAEFELNPGRSGRTSPIAPAAACSSFRFPPPILTPAIRQRRAVASYTVTFPAAGHYDLYARVRVGPDAFNDDSLFYGNGFGTKSPTADGDWIFVNGWRWRVLRRR